MPEHTFSDDRYERPDGWFRRCGASGLMMPALSLGCWHNFGAAGSGSHGIADEPGFHEQCQRMLFTAFDLGITHFDLANNYGPPGGAAEQRVGRILKDMPRDELIISTKAGHRMWPGPLGRGGSRKHMLASLDQSLERLGLDYVDIYYHHTPDADTSLEETLAALDQAIASGKAIYAGVSNYPGALLADAARVCDLHRLHRPIIHQPAYHMLHRSIETDLWPVVERFGVGVIAFCPLAQGLLTDKYLDGIPDDSRAASKAGFLMADRVNDEVRAKLHKLNAIASDRGQSLAQMALAWVLRDRRITSALIGASRPEQIEQNATCLDADPFTDDELAAIDEIVNA